MSGRKKYHPLSILNTINKESGKIMFGNWAGLKQNLEGSYTNLTTKKITTNFSSDEEKKLCSKLATQGHINLQNLYEDKLIQTILEKFNKAIEDKKNYNIISKYDENIYSLELVKPPITIPESRNLLNNKITIFVKNYFQSYFKLAHFKIWRNYHIPPKLEQRREMFSNWWHCDPTNSSWTKLFVYLDDVTEKNGPFHVQTKGRTKELMKKGFGSRKNYNLPNEVLEDPKYVWHATGKEGTCFMCNCQLGLHRAGVPEPGHYRTCALITFVPSNKPLEKDWQNHLVDQKYFL